MTQEQIEPTIEDFENLVRQYNMIPHLTAIVLDRKYSALKKEVENTKASIKKPTG